MKSFVMFQDVNSLACSGTQNCCQSLRCIPGLVEPVLKSLENFPTFYTNGQSSSVISELFIHAVHT
jgi:hypothetical protein